MWVPVERAIRKNYYVLDMRGSNNPLYQPNVLETWCENNLKHNWCVEHYKITKRYFCNEFTTKNKTLIGPWFYFENRTEALLFKLKWS